MPQIFFLDTNVILDYLENRDRNVMDTIAQLLLFHKKGKISLVTSVYNIAELVDTEFDIRFTEACMNEKMSCDEILLKRKRDEKLYRNIAEKNREKIQKIIKDFIFDNEVRILTLSFIDPEKYEEIYKLIYNFLLRPQDALIVATALSNDVTYFLSNDSELVDSLAESLNSFNLRNKTQCQNFRNNVLEAI